MHKLPSTGRKVHKCWAIRVMEGPKKERPGGLLQGLLIPLWLMNLRKASEASVRCEEWTTGEQLCFKQQRRCEVVSSCREEEILTQKKSFRKEQTVEFKKLKSLLIHQPKLLTPNPKPLDFQGDFLGISVAWRNIAGNTAPYCMCRLDGV